MNPQPLLLDTYALIWIAENVKLAPPAVVVLNEAYHSGAVTYVSPISAWEIGQLAARDRLKFLVTPHRWFQLVLARPGLQLADLSPDILIASSFLPGNPPRDPADRIIAATARDLGCTMLTRDRKLLDYADQGHIRVVTC